MEHEPSSDAAVVARFDGEMVDIYRRTGEAFDYWPNYFPEERKIARDRLAMYGFDFERYGLK